MLPLLAFAGIGAAANAGFSIFGAASRNAAIEESMRRNQMAAEAELAQQARINDLQVMRSRRTAARTFGMIAVSAAERGVGPGGSVAALDRNAAVDESLNQYALGIEHYGADLRTRISLSNSQRALAGQGQDYLLAGLTGAIQGAQTGLSIGQGIKGIMSSPDLPPLYDVGPPKYLQ